LDMRNEFNVALGLMLEIGGIVPSKKKYFWNFLNSTWTMINVLTIFLAQYF
jgi:hypothetical protein